MVGSALIAIGYGLSCLATNINHLYLSIGILVGKNIFRLLVALSIHSFSLSLIIKDLFLNFFGTSLFPSFIHFFYSFP